MKYIFLLLFSVATLLSSNTFLNPDDAFKASYKKLGASKVKLFVELGKDIYIYKDQVRVEVISPEFINVKKVLFPPSVNHDGVDVFEHSADLLVTLEKTSEQVTTSIVELMLTYQGCSSQGLCYEPMSSTFKFEVDFSKLPMSKTVATKVEPKPAIAPVEVSEVSKTQSIADTIKNENIFIILLTFLGFGLLLSLTPCIFPMIPILSGIIIAQGEGITTRRAFTLSLVYVLAMALAYTIAGVLAGLFGSNIQAALQAPWVIVLFSAIFVVLSMSMFDVYQLQLPSSLQSKVSHATDGKKGLLGVAIMGFLSALIVGPCVAAPLAGALIYIGQSGDAILGGMALFALGLGMGIPLLLVGVSAGKFMPRPGGWMDTIKHIFGVMLLGVAIWMLSRIVPDSITMLLIAILLLFVSVHLGTFESATNVNKRSIGLIIFLYATSLFIGSLSGSTNLLKPFEKFTNSSLHVEQKSASLKFIKVHSIEEFEKVLEQNRGKKVMLDFWASWCVSCKELSSATLSDATVISALSNYVLIKADISSNSDEEKALSKKLNIFGPPALIFFNEDGKELKSKRIIGYVNANDFLNNLNK